MKKIKLLIILILFIIVILTIKFYTNSEYSLNEIASIIDKSEEIPDNINIKMETIYIEGKKNIYEIYAKNDIIYTHQEDIENGEVINKEDELWNYTDKSIITIDYDKKVIYNKEIKGNGKINPLTELLLGISRSIKVTPSKLYKYYGITKNEEKEFLKFSLETEDNFCKMYYYISNEDWNVSKIESYKNNELEANCILTYNYGTVTDEDILKFDINDYADYQFIKR